MSHTYYYHPYSGSAGYIQANHYVAPTYKEDLYSHLRSFIPVMSAETSAETLAQSPRQKPKGAALSSWRTDIERFNELTQIRIRLAIHRLRKFYLRLPARIRNSRSPVGPVSYLPDPYY